MIQKPISTRLLEGLRDRPGIRSRLVTTTDTDITSDIKQALNQITGDYRDETLLARAITAKAMAQQLSHDGSFDAHDDRAWDLGSSTRQYANANSQEDQVLTRLVRCMSSDLQLAAQHIVSLAQLLMTRGIRINFDKLYYDLLGWDNVQSMSKVRWATSFCELKSS